MLEMDNIRRLGVFQRLMLLMEFRMLSRVILIVIRFQDPVNTIRRVKVLRSNQSISQNDCNSLVQQ